MKYCPFCGALRKLEQSRFCMKCGSEFSADAVENMTEAAATQDDGRNSGNRKLIVIDAILAVLIMVLVVLILNGLFSA